jgi:hypothetical protein
MAGLFFGPLAFFPVFYAMTMVGDTLLGDRLILDHFIHVSKRDIWDMFWSDWISALLASYAFVLPLLVLAIAAKQKWRVNLVLALPSAGLLAAAMISFIFFAGSNLPILVATVVLFFVPMSWILQRYSQ